MVKEIKVNELTFIVGKLGTIPLMPMGVLATRCAHPPLGPSIHISENVTPHVSEESPSNISPNPSSHIRSFGTLGQLLKIPPCPPTNFIAGGGHSGPKSMSTWHQLKISQTIVSINISVFGPNTYFNTQRHVLKGYSFMLLNKFRDFY